MSRIGRQGVSGEVIGGARLWVGVGLGMGPGGDGGVCAIGGGAWVRMGNDYIANFQLASVTDSYRPGAACHTDGSIEFTGTIAMLDKI